MSFIELLSHPPFRIVMIGCLLSFALLAGTIIWYIKVGRPREKKFNEKQKKHLAFRRALLLPVIVGSVVSTQWDWNLPVIIMRNGEELPLKLLILLGTYLALYCAVFVAGNIIFGEEGRLKPKKRT